MVMQLSRHLIYLDPRGAATGRQTGGIATQRGTGDLGLAYRRAEDGAD
jgi:hypothetical protein